MAWHGKCYKLRIGDKFPIAKLDEAEGIHDPTDDNKFTMQEMGTISIAHFSVIFATSGTYSIGTLTREEDKTGTC